MSKDAVRELRATRLALYNLFGFQPPEEGRNQFQRSEHVRTFSSETPLQFTFARLLITALRLLDSTFGQQTRDDEAVYICAEAFGFIKGNFAISGTGLEALNAAIFIWKYLREHKNPLFSGPTASYWLQELKDMCVLLTGKIYYEKHYHRFVQAVEDRTVG